jgi:hypothetical protein
MGRLASFLRRQKSGHGAAWPYLYVPEVVADRTAHLIASYGKPGEPHEGITYWAGVPSEKNWVVTTVLAPNATTTSGSYRTSAVDNAKVIARVNGLRLHILAQLHGHPGEWVGHSEGDNRGAFMPYEGFYSIVVPWYGHNGLLPLQQCGVHRYENGKFRRLTDTTLQRQFVVVPSSVDLRTRT